MKNMRYQLDQWDTKDLEAWLFDLRKDRKQYELMGLCSLPQYKAIDERIVAIYAELRKRR